MAKTVYTGPEIPHLYAAGEVTYARNSNDSVRIEDGILWSYRAPIAARLGGRVLINSDHFSVTTSKHQARARYALQHLNPLMVPNLADLVRRDRDIPAYIAERAKEMDSIRDRMKRMRSDWKIRGAVSEISHLEEVCAFVWRSAIKVHDKATRQAEIRRFEASRRRLDSAMSVAQDMIGRTRENIERDVTDGRTYGLQSWWHLEHTVKDILRLDEMGVRNNSATFRRARKIMGKKWADECVSLARQLAEYAASFADEIRELRAEYDREMAREESEIIAEWIAGGKRAPRETIVCRIINGDTVETSRGARVPLSDALAVANLAESCRNSGRALNLENRKIGQYRGNSIDAQGNLTVGCHHITWEAIADCLSRYNAMESVE